MKQSISLDVYRAMKKYFIGVIGRGYRIGLATATPLLSTGNTSKRGSEVVGPCAVTGVSVENFDGLILI